MELGDLDYHLPPELIAQTPAASRTDARLLLVARRGGVEGHHHVADLPSLLEAGDLLVVNDARVRPARVRGRRPSGGRLDILLLEAEGPEDREWSALVRGSPRVGETVELPRARGRWTACCGGGRWRLRLETAEPVGAWLEAVGDMPLPPYIRRPRGATGEDRERYQTVFARRAEAVAAPTAGLHFTNALLATLRSAGIEHVALTLAIGPATFLPIRDGSLETFRMGPERYDIPAATVRAIEETRRRSRRVVAVGTTTVRALESAAESGRLAAGPGVSELFIRPGYRFRVVDALMTNFHLPRTPLLALVAAFAGWPSVRGAYETAVAERYRFYSYGDAMLIR